MDKRLTTIQDGVELGVITHERSHRMNASDICAEVRFLQQQLEAVDKKYGEVVELLHEYGIVDTTGFTRLKDLTKTVLIWVYSNKLTVTVQTQMCDGKRAHDKTRRETSPCINLAG
eukprot:1092327-Amphidinium_carterae.2